MMMVGLVGTFAFPPESVNAQWPNPTIQVSRQTQKREMAQVKRHMISSNRPTVFVHGLGGRFKSETSLVGPAVTNGVASKGMLVRVDMDGHLHVKGSIKNKVNPVILVKFDDNVAGEVKDAHWLAKVMRLLKTRYHVTDYNLVGHSMGAYAAVYYAEKLSHHATQPTLKKLVTIAGPFDGIMHLRPIWHYMASPSVSRLQSDKVNENFLLASGRPYLIHHDYAALLRDKARFPKGVEVMNLYGNVENGTNSDRVVSTTSAQSLRYLVKGRAKSYHEYELTGPTATHSGLRSTNQRVKQLMAQFLWAK